MSVPGDLPGEILPRLARAVIRDRLGLGARLSRDRLDPRLLEPGASFVTLKRGGALRGCVGSLEARRPLVDDVEANARVAAFEDPRFPPLAAAELAATRVEVSVLGPLIEVEAASPEELARRLVPGEDGLVLTAAERRATFLPQVWEELPETAAFIDHLRRKAGLGADFWKLRPAFLRYRVRKWAEG